MKSGWRIGSIFGIPLMLDPSWFFILLGVTYVYGATWQDLDWGQNIAWIAGFVMALALFGSVLLHELGHSLVARSQGIKVNSITLFLFGGIASIDRESKTPGQAFQVAIAGPAVSFSLFVLLFLVRQAVGWSEPLTTIVRDLAGINLMLAIFNMIPGLPLDGGQVLKAAIWKATGDRFKGVRWAARVGQALGWTAIILGMTLFFRFGSFDALWISLLGWFGVRNANAYSSLITVQEALLRIKAADAMTRDFRVVEANWSLREFAEHHLLHEAPPTTYYAASNGRYRGMVSVDVLRQTDRDLWDQRTLKDIAEPLESIPSILETAPLAEVVQTLETNQAKRLTVLSPAGAVSGVIDRGDVVQAVAEKMRIAIPKRMIQQIKDEGTYPPGLPLEAIAKSALD
jgi:Zn-dependent protease